MICILCECNYRCTDKALADYWWPIVWHQLSVGR